MAWRGGRVADAGRHFEKAIYLYESIADHHAAARVSAADAEVLGVEGDIEESAERMERAFQILRVDEADADLATLAHQLARVLWLMGEPERAAEPLEVALQVAESLRLPGILSEALNTKGGIALWRGRIEEASALFGHALKIALDHDLPTPALRAFNNLGYQLES